MWGALRMVIMGYEERARLSLIIFQLEPIEVGQRERVISPLRSFFSGDYRGFFFNSFSFLSVILFSLIS
jgi:hypothetical protein